MVFVLGLRPASLSPNQCQNEMCSHNKKASNSVETKWWPSSLLSGRYRFQLNPFILFFIYIYSNISLENVSLFTLLARGSG